MRVVGFWYCILSQSGARCVSLCSFGCSELAVLDGWRECWAGQLLVFLDGLKFDIWGLVPDCPRASAEALQALASKSLPVREVASKLREALMYGNKNG